jgi:hypothetical protein
MNQEDIIAFVKREVKPLPPLPTMSEGARYRVAATLNDGTFMPCVVIEDASYRVKLAIRRFEETRTSNDPYMGYAALVKSFVTRGNTVNDYDLRELSISPYAIPLAREKEIGGETSMGWTEFYATMSDGKEFRFGTRFYTEFFDMPPNYTSSDIVRIIPAVRGEKPRIEVIYREKPFFTCFVDGLR